MPRTHRPDPPEFRAEAVRLARGGDKSIPALAADLGVSSEALRHWLRQAEADAGRGQSGEPTTDERGELRRLRRENHILKQEREIRRKAAASFARETLVYCGHWFGGGGEAVETRAARAAPHRVAPAADGSAPVCTVTRERVPGGPDHASRGKTRAAHRIAATAPTTHAAGRKEQDGRYRPRLSTVRRH